MANEIDLSIIIISFNTKDLLRECLEAIIKEAKGISNEIIVVDNASKDGSADMVQTSFPSVCLVRNSTNLGFGAANNVGFKMARGKYIVLLNSDAFLHPGALKKALLKVQSDPSIGMVGGRLVGRDGAWQPSARQFPSLLNEFLHLFGLATKFPHSRFFGKADNTWRRFDEPFETDWVPGAFAIMPKKVLDEVGYFDENFFLYYEEVDLCKRIKSAKYKIWYWPDIVVTHLGGESSKTVKTLSFFSIGSQLTLWRYRSQLLYYRKHSGYLNANAIRCLEVGLFTLRSWINRYKKDPDSIAKEQESRVIASLMDQAWQETQGGKISPPRPW